MLSRFLSAAAWPPEQQSNTIRHICTAAPLAMAAAKDSRLPFDSKDDLLRLLSRCQAALEADIEAVAVAAAGTSAGASAAAATSPAAGGSAHRGTPADRTAASDAPSVDAAAAAATTGRPVRLNCPEWQSPWARPVAKLLVALQHWAWQHVPGGPGPADDADGERCTAMLVAARHLARHEAQLAQRSASAMGGEVLAGITAPVTSLIKWVQLELYVTSLCNQLREAYDRLPYPFQPYVPPSSNDSGARGRGGRQGNGGSNGKNSGSDGSSGDSGGSGAGGGSRGGNHSVPLPPADECAAFARLSGITAAVAQEWNHVIEANPGQRGGEGAWPLLGEAAAAGLPVALWQLHLQLPSERAAANGAQPAVPAPGAGSSGCSLCAAAIHTAKFGAMALRGMMADGLEALEQQPCGHFLVRELVDFSCHDIMQLQRLALAAGGAGLWRELLRVRAVALEACCAVVEAVAAAAEQKPPQLASSYMTQAAIAAVVANAGKRQSCMLLLPQLRPPLQAGLLMMLSVLHCMSHCRARTPCRSNIFVSLQHIKVNAAVCRSLR